MDETQNETQAAAQQPAAQPEQAAAQAAPAVSYVVVTPIDHDRSHYQIGDLFPASVATAEQLAELLKVGALKFAHEVEAAARVAVDLAAKDEELARLRAEIAALQAKASGKR